MTSTDPLTPQHLYSVPATPPTAREQTAQVRQRTAWTAAELMATEFPEPKWAVPGILSEGVNLLAGPPKVGKSWLSLGLGLAVAAGGKAFDVVPVEGGPVLYLALEDTPRRLQTRMGKVLGGQPAPRGLTLATQCPPLPQGGNEAIANWLDRHPDARMVVVDVFAKMRGASAPGASAYDADYAAVGHAKRLADHYGVAVVLVHHVRKAGSDDFLTEVSGTNGLAGAADATLVLKRARGQADGILHVTGRDVDEAEYALKFHKGSGAWQLLEGPATDHTIGDTRAAILRHVRENPGVRPRDIVAALPEVDADTVRRYCSRMVDAGQLGKDAAGRYFPSPVPGEVSQVSDCPVTPHDLHEHPGHPQTPSVRLSDSTHGGSAQ
ncbi:AAA family ATPase [Streptomyces sp. PSKA54]|uniref:AAA family ATPase n=1 Tax=Streptomyces himalayensis subsp. aureolus TaxID=2758039 RepID=A0A7W2HFE1_9ACTN|nr:AAA family ATPase [Streptomyces himalayensis]MBA4861736.1 AAA family ATPase [Streptomyces himalayensis subsp. aureolus]